VIRWQITPTLSASVIHHLFVENNRLWMRLRRISGASGFHRQDFSSSLLILDLSLVPFTRQRLPMIALVRSSCSTLLANCRAHLPRLLLVLLLSSLSQKHPFLHHGKHKPSLRQKHHVVSTTWESRWHTCSLRASKEFSRETTNGPGVPSSREFP
jgi:hypothetical protein